MRELLFISEMENKEVMALDVCPVRWESWKRSQYSSLENYSCIFLLNCKESSRLNLAISQ